jgi:HAD superfamily hydrolase (TIGR01509 family)
LKYEAAFFDLGSTLIEFENHDWHTMGKTGIINAYPFMKERFPRLLEVNKFGPTFYEYLKDILDRRDDYSEIALTESCAMIFERMGMQINDGIIEKFIDIYYQPITDQITLIPGAVEILDKLKNAGLIIGLVSNSIFPEKYHLGEMEQFGLLKYFDFTIFSSGVGVRKPGRAIFDIALRKAGVKASRAIFVGDRFDADIIGAKNAGIVSVWKFRENRENPENVKPDYSIVNLEELETIVLEKE